MRVNDLVRFIKERESIRIKKEAGKPRPWTKDSILDKYRFCNVHREDDRVTQWLRANWYSKFEKAPNVWFVAVVARLLNQPDSLIDVIEYTLPFKPIPFAAMLHGRKLQGLKNFNAAYIVSTNGIAMDKVNYIVERVLNPLWADRDKLRKFPDHVGEPLRKFYEALIRYDGLGSFIAAQVIADLKYVKRWQDAIPVDLYTFAAPGPGSRRGLNRVMGFPLTLSLPEAGWKAHLNDLRAAVNKKLFTQNMTELDAQDLQNCLCEFDKYERARLGEGTPKQIYKERESG